MISWFKNIFIPHVGNDHRPHILRNENIRSMIAIIILLEVSTFLLPTLIQLNKTGGMAAVLPAVLTNLTNEERQDQSLKTLTVNENLNKAAEMKAKDMATYGYFAHVSPEGKTPWYWIEKVGYKYQYAGENLAINFSDSKDVTNAWMTSPTHKANIVKGNYTEIGTGVAVGIYEGKETVFVAQVYANPMPEILKQMEVKKTNIQKKEKVLKPDKGESKDVLGVETVATNIATENNLTEKVTINDNLSVQKPTFIQKIMVSPRDTTNKVMFLIFGFIAISLLLNVFIKIRHHHLDLVTNGLISLALIIAILVGNYYLSHRDMMITQSLDYSAESKLNL